MRFICIILVLALAVEVSSLECYTCQGNEPLDPKCDGKKVTCQKSQTRCAKEYYMLGNNKIYSKTCTTENLCDTKYFCGTVIGMKDCKVHCCDTDLCNAGSTRLVSVLMVYACAAIALLALYMNEK